MDTVLDVPRSRSNISTGICDGPGESVGSFRLDASRAIDALGSEADFLVLTGVWLHVGQWLGWPKWLYEGTRIEPSEPLPRKISVAEDLLIARNVLEHIAAGDMVRRLIKRSRPALGPNSAAIYASAPTLAALLSRLEKGVNANNYYFKTALVEDGPSQIFVLSERVPLGQLGSILGLLALITVYQIIQPLAFEQIGEVILQTTLPDNSPWLAELSELQCQVQTRQQHNRLIIPARLGDLRNPEFDPATWTLSEPASIECPSDRYHVPIDSRVREIVVDLLSRGGQGPRLKQVSAEIGISGRTIMRSLGKSGTSFQAIVDGERQRIALQLIEDPRLNLDTISRRLGFTDKSSFGRSFRKWVGESPGQYRRNSLTRSN